jgi:hypothetical protein
MKAELDMVSGVVQRNCNISDARHARQYTLCAYLLKMREFFRWERGYALTDILPKDDLGSWVDERERLWETLEAEGFRQIDLDGQSFDPFESAAINAYLVPQGLVYSGGFGRYCQPHFFLGSLLESYRRDGVSILVSADEYARDLVAPPAMLQGDVVYVRREAVRRMLWEKVEEWRWRQQDNAMGRALTAYGLDADPGRGFERMTACQVEIMVLHELGEAAAGRLWGEAAWTGMLGDLARSPAEIRIRALRDLLADCLSTLPGLLHNDEPGALHLYFANFSGMRRELFPDLWLAYQHWLATQDSGPIARAAAAGGRHWAELGAAVLRLHREADGEPCGQPIQDLIEGRKL